MKTRSFVHELNSPRVVFGAGTYRTLPAEVEQLGVKRCLVLSTPEQRHHAERTADLLGSLAVGIHGHAKMHVPIEAVDSALLVANGLKVDALVSYGGGSTTGLAKGVALRCGLPIIAIPTTYAGSEMTSIYGVTENSRKQTGKDARVMPRTVIYDPELTYDLPLEISIASGLNAIAHAAEGLYSRNKNPIVGLIAEEGIRALAGGLSALSSGAGGEDARASCLYGAWLCAMVLENAEMALHHKLCHTLGGSFNLPHAQMHAVILPHAIAYNARSSPDASRRILRALQAPNVSPATALHDLAQRLGAPLSLRELGMSKDDLGAAARIAMQNPYWNPVPLTYEGLNSLLCRAYEGSKPDDVQ